MRPRLAALAVSAALVLVPATAAQPAEDGYPDSMASTGDSITRAFTRIRPLAWLGD